MKLANGTARQGEAETPGADGPYAVSSTQDLASKNVPVNWFCFQSKAVELNTFESIQPLQVQYCNQNPKNKKKVVEKTWKKKNTVQRIMCKKNLPQAPGH